MGRSARRVEERKGDMIIMMLMEGPMMSDEAHLEY